MGLTEQMVDQNEFRAAFTARMNDMDHEGIPDFLKEVINEWRAPIEVIEGLIEVAGEVMVDSGYSSTKSIRPNGALHAEAIEVVRHASFVFFAVDELTSVDGAVEVFGRAYKKIRDIPSEPDLQMLWGAVMVIGNVRI